MQSIAAGIRPSRLNGSGSPDGDLSHEDLRGIVEDALRGVEANSRVLAVVPDKTRDDNTHILFPFSSEILLSKNVARFDALIAQGTHAPMTPDEKAKKIGIGDGIVLDGLGRVYDHHWSDASELVQIGELTAGVVAELTNGLFKKAIPLTINRLLAPGGYDHILIFGATVPHEVAGFAGGAKYFFPGVSGSELTHATHWLGALAG
ncbi:MAG: lactate racemase domain-containing protein, partial [Pyrinomonadaceae bacterium]